MKNINKNIILGTALAAVLMNGQQGVNAAESVTKIHPLTSKMVISVKDAPSAAAALENLCKQGGVIRGSGFSAGDNCKLQDFARIALAACDGYSKGKDSFKGSKCQKKADGVSINDVQKAVDSLTQAVTANVPYLTNARLFICGPEELGDGVMAYRAKLPGRLKSIADTS